jgi:hypothetical protein
MLIAVSKAIEYKYNPELFRGILGLSDELAAFYKLHEAFSMNKTQDNRFALEKHGRDLFFTIKHRAVEGAITQTLAHEIREYIEDLLND